MKTIIEVCCGSLEDALLAEKGGADRIELNDSLFLSGITPSFGLVQAVLEQCTIPVVPMIRPRGAGFHYDEYEFETMRRDAEILAAENIAGAAFGCLQANGKIDPEQTREIVHILQANQKEAIFHRAFDNVPNPFEAVETLIELGVKRVLTSGQKTKAIEGTVLLKQLQERYGNQIEILAGSGVDAANIEQLRAETGLTQFHSSCKTWKNDPTTSLQIPFGFAPAPHENDYTGVDLEKVRALVKKVR